PGARAAVGTSARRRARDGHALALRPPLGQVVLLQPGRTGVPRLQGRCLRSGRLRGSDRRSGRGRELAAGVPGVRARARLARCCPRRRRALPPALRTERAEGALPRRRGRDRRRLVRARGTACSQGAPVRPSARARRLHGGVRLRRRCRRVARGGADGGRGGVARPPAAARLHNGVRLALRRGRLGCAVRDRSRRIRSGRGVFPSRCVASGPRSLVVVDAAPADDAERVQRVAGRRNRRLGPAARVRAGVPELFPLRGGAGSERSALPLPTRSAQGSPPAQRHVPARQPSCLQPQVFSRVAEALRRLRAHCRPAARRHRRAGGGGLSPARGAAPVSASTAAAFALAAASALALNWAYFTQHQQASRLPPLSVRRPLHSLLLLFSNRRWLAGFTIGIGGWVLYVAALSLGALSLVQAASAGGIGILALLVWRLGDVPLSRREWGGVGLAISGLVLLAVSLARSGTTHPFAAHASGVGVAAWWAVPGGLSAAFAGPSARLLAGGAGLGVAAGLCYAAGDVGTKAAVGGGARLLFALPVLTAHGLGFVFLQLGFQRGGALATAGV